MNAELIRKAAAKYDVKPMVKLALSAGCGITDEPTRETILIKAAQALIYEDENPNGLSSYLRLLALTEEIAAEPHANE